MGVGLRVALTDRSIHEALLPPIDMRITFDFSPALHRHAGVGRYAHELLSAMMQLDTTNQYRVFHNRPGSGEVVPPPFDALPRTVVPLSAKPWRLSVLLSYLCNISMDRWLPSCDLFHATDYLLPLLHHAKSVITIYDLTVLLFPEYHLPLNRWYVSLMLPSFLRHAIRVIATSENTRRDIAQRMRIPIEKIAVTYLGVNPTFHPIEDAMELARVRVRYNLPPRFILYLGTIEPRKNLLTLLDAYHSLVSREHTMPKLVISGNRGWLHQPVFQHVRELGLTEYVYFTGWVDDQDIPTLMNAATIFVYPSLYEGFGLPPLEAMACGTPVVCSSASSLPEIIGDGGLLVEPRNADAWAQAMTRLVDDEQMRADLRQRGIAQARRFSWERTARETLAIYQSTIQGQNANHD